MSKFPRTPAEAAERFAAALPAAPARVEVRLDSVQGMPGLCAVEAVLARAWPAGAAKELVWLTRAADADRDQLELRAYGPANELLAEAVHEFRGG
jgi:hypothetical protein